MPVCNTQTATSYCTINKPFVLAHVLKALAVPPLSLGTGRRVATVIHKWRRHSSWLRHCHGNCTADATVIHERHRHSGWPQQHRHCRSTTATVPLQCPCSATPPTSSLGRDCTAAPPWHCRTGTTAHTTATTPQNVAQLSACGGNAAA